MMMDVEGLCPMGCGKTLHVNTGNGVVHCIERREVGQHGVHVVGHFLPAPHVGHVAGSAVGRGSQRQRHIGRQLLAQLVNVG
jgi:hypothetical protein